MANRSRRAHRLRAERELKLYPCTHCDTERIVAPLSEFVGFARKEPQLGLESVLDSMRAYVGRDGMVSLCPGCFCITSDLSDTHGH